MKEELVSYKQAVILKKLGFSEEVSSIYSSHSKKLYEKLPWANYNEELCHLGEENEPTEGQLVYAAPTLSLAQKWLLEKHNLLIVIQPFQYCAENGNYRIEYDYSIYHGISFGDLNFIGKGSGFLDYEVAFMFAIDKCIQQIQDNLIYLEKVIEMFNYKE